MNALEQENQYLKLRVAQLQEDVSDLSAEVSRLRQRLEQLTARRAPQPPNPLGGGQ
jgi:ubiquinone biosynthesis protein UbiJ